MSKVQRSGSPGQHGYRVIIYPSRVRLTLLTSLSVLLVLAGLFACYWGWRTAVATSIFLNRGLLAGIPAVLFFGFCLVYCIVRFVDRKPSLIIDNNGVYDNSSAATVGLIPWDNIRGVAILSVNRQRSLAVFVQDPEPVLSRASGLKRMALRANAKMTGTPVNLAENVLPIRLEEVEAEIHHNLRTRPTRG